jgi:hypothetical protein
VAPLKDPLAFWEECVFLSTGCAEFSVVVRSEEQSAGLAAVDDSSGSDPAGEAAHPQQEETEMFRLPKLSLVLTVVALALLAAPAWADQWPLVGHSTFTGGQPPTVTFDFVGTKGDGTAVKGSGQFDFDSTTGVISNGMATLVWEDGFSPTIEFSGQALPDGTFVGTWDQIDGNLSGTFSGTTDFSTGADVEFDCIG